MLGLGRRFMALGAASLLALTLVGGASAAAPSKYSAVLVDDGGCSFHMEASWQGGRAVVRVVSYVYIDRSPVGAGAPDLVGFAPDSLGSSLTKTSASIPFGPLEVDTATTHTFAATVQFDGQARSGLYTLGQVYTTAITLGCKLATP